MPVQFFIGRSPQGQPQPPEYSHEMRATIDICKLLWRAFQPHQPYYAVVANLNDPSLDLMVISEWGIGVMELKHYFGRITCHNDGAWYAGPKRMIAGVDGRGFKNPHEQVQMYAEQIRNQLITPPPWQKPWLPGKTIDWEQFKFQTAVCFTHPDADLTDFDSQLRRTCRPVTLPWENFSVLTPDLVPEWAVSLRFEVAAGRSQGYTRHRYHPAEIVRLTEELFQLSPWEEIEGLMPSGQPYALLSRLENHRPVQDYPLELDRILIGRDISNCDITIPEKFFLVSRMHARLIRDVEGLFIEDLSSTNGTFVDGQQIHKRTALRQGSLITLGSEEVGPGACQFELSLQVDGPAGIDATQKLRGVQRPEDPS